MKKVDIDDAQLEEGAKGAQPTAADIDASKPPTHTRGLDLDDNYGIEDVDDEDQNKDDNDQVPTNMGSSRAPPGTKNSNINNNQSLTQSQITNVNIKNRKTNINPNTDSRSFYGFSNISNTSKDGSVTTNMKERDNDNNQQSQHGGFWPFVMETEEERKERLHERKERLKAQAHLKDDVEWQIANAIVYGNNVYRPIVTGLPVEEIRELAKSWKLEEDQTTGCSQGFGRAQTENEKL